MYCVHSNNYDAFEVLLELDVDLLWKNNTGANVMQILAKKGFLNLAARCWENLQRKPKSHQEKFINNQSYNG